MTDTKLGEPLVLEAGDLRCLIADNSPWKDHRLGYHGIGSLTHSACEGSPFVPLYAGVNLEFLFDGVRHNMEPRWLGDGDDRQATPTDVKYSGKSRATVHWPETPDWAVEAWVAYQVVEPHYIDVSIRLQPRKKSFQRGYMGAFFASYMDAPEIREFQFWGREASSSVEGWQTSVLRDGEHTAFYPCARESGNCSTEEFFFGPRSSLVFEKPLMFGTWRNMVLAWFLDSGDALRLAYNATVGGSDNPAWDFALFVPGYKERRIYSRSLRLMYKPFVSPDDVMQEYEAWAVSRQR